MNNELIQDIMARHEYEYDIIVKKLASQELVIVELQKALTCIEKTLAKLL